MSSKSNRKRANPQDYMPSAEEVAAELAKAESMDDFFGKEGIFANLFSSTLEQMLEAELTDHLGYEPYEAKGRNSGNSRNGSYSKTVRTSEGDTTIHVPRDRKSEFEPKILEKYVWGRGIGQHHQHHHRQSLVAGGSLAESPPGSDLPHRLPGRSPPQAAA